MRNLSYLISIISRQKLIFIILVFFLFGCAAHPTVAYKTMKKGEKLYGYSFSIENVFPVLFYRYGISEISDVGFRLGLPIYGSGFDYSRILFQSGQKRDVLNIAWSWTPNSNFDFTYYKFTEKKKRPGVVTYWGLRGMFIPKGITGGRSLRIGLLLGSNLKGKFGYEIGYFHDSAGIPITQIFTPKFDETNPDWDDRYNQYPLTSDFGFPTEHARITGLSIRLHFFINTNNEKKSKGDSESVDNN